MRYTIMPDGSLKITADNETRSYLADQYRKGYCEAEGFVSEMLQDALTFIRPEAIGALTDAPILTDDADYSDEQMEHGIGPAPYPEAHVWWFEGYQIVGPWQQLANRGRVVFQAATWERVPIAGADHIMGATIAKLRL